MHLKEFFEEYGIQYWTKGKNVSKGNINITCLFCDDESNHLGIRKSDLKCNCWKCGGHYIGRVISKIANCSLKEAKEIVKTLEVVGSIWDGTSSEENTTPFKFPKRAQLPPESTKEFPSLHLRYLRSRGFNPRRIIRKYDLYACYTDGDFKFRIIIPIYQNHKLVAYTSRDVTDTQELRYKAAERPHCIIDPREAIYNYDSIKPYKDAFLVEGPTDVWKMGDGSFCFMGVKMTPQRLLEIAEKKINNLYLFFDNDKTGLRESKKIASIIAPMIMGKTHILKLNKYKDPGKLNRTQVAHIKEIIEFDY